MDHRGSKGNTHMEGERTGEVERDGGEKERKNVSTGSTHMNGKGNKGGLCEGNEKQIQTETVRDHHSF